MAKAYNEYEQESMAKANQQHAEYEAKKRAYTGTYVDELNKAVDTATAPLQSKIKNQISDMPAQYRSQYDANAIQELVGRRQVEETMANLGMTDSGLNRVTQTGLSVQRGNADATTRNAQQAAVDALNQSLSELLANASSQKQSQAASIYNQLDSDIQNNYTSLYQNALNNAYSLYGTDTQSEMQQIQLAQEKALADAQREEAKRQAEQNMAYKYEALNYEKSKS